MVPIQGSAAEQALCPEAVFSPAPVGCPPFALARVGAGEASGIDPFHFLQVTKDALVYSTFLLHKPRPVGNLSILRTNFAEVPIECRFPRSVWDRPVAACDAARQPLGSFRGIAARRWKCLGCGHCPQPWLGWGPVESVLSL